ncbi:Tol biopolymer transport system component [Breznakibacter xylanolyticus]|uniref:Tol biopolymer transport system component n=1 Tax=Breznakibacter xylanolyticus TaxID=990 RepID=A0A2W7NB64_9BACT|nr:Tol biopolymer transport system component [Breznakibacter xylanolyticus]
MSPNRQKLIVLTVALWGIMMLSANAQYFGTNKPIYKQLNYELYQTPHFEIYHYLTDSILLNQMAADCEKWYFYHSGVFAETFKRRNPVIVYTNHADFQQTTAIMSQIDVGVGGVTEGLKRRVVFPLAFTQQETDHVLGHELVHAFQYHIITESENLSLGAIQNIPLWMIEGMAEYLSIGSVSSHTALWMRDALISRNFPSLEKLTFNPTYSPYRFGHAFWAYIAATYGEQYINRLFRETANKGFPASIGEVLGISSDSLSKNWESALRKQLLTRQADTTFSIVGERLLAKGESGRYNLAPSLSPDGQHIIFMSERDLFSLDLFLANVKTGKVMRRIFTATRYDHIDALNMLQTSGTWSPDGRTFTFVGFVKGKTVLLCYNIDKDKIDHQIEIPDIDAIGYPAWSPDGTTIAFAGLHQGVSDLYLWHVNNRQLTNLTLGRGSCIMPAWSADGNRLFFTTEMPAPGQINVGFPYTNIATIDLKYGQITVYKTFDGARNVNPLPMNGGHDVVFLSDGDGRRNLFSINTQSRALRQLTDYPTGICGATEFSPALTTAGDTLVYCMLWDGRFTLFKTTYNRLAQMSVASTPATTNYKDLRLMPYTQHLSQVENNLYFRNRPHHLVPDSFSIAPIRRHFKLDYLGNVSAGVMAGRFGTGMAGSVEALFSDILGQHMLYSGVSINGEIYDFGGQVAYVNQQSRLKKGVSLSHIPYPTASLTYETETADDGTQTKSLSYLFRRTFEDKLSLFAFYPFSRTRRVESGIAWAWYSYRDEKIKNVTSYNDIYYSKTEPVESPPGFRVAILDAAIVIDNAKMGLASPNEGRRLRIQTERYLFGLDMQTFSVDYRQYWFLNPSCIALRTYHYGRYGSDSQDKRLMNLYMGYPWYLRGYESGSYYNNDDIDQQSVGISQLLGSRILVTNAEWRVPFTGPPEVSVVRSYSLYSELAFFVDAGLAWNRTAHPIWSLTTNDPQKRVPVFSTGLGYRINLYGLLVVEPYFAFPFYQKEFREGRFGVNLFSGW